MEKVSSEIATKDVNGWLDFKKVSAKRREELAPVIEGLVDMVQEGVLVIDDKTFEITQKLKLPLGDGATTELVFKPRVTGGQLQEAMTGVKFNDEYGKTFARISAATGKSKNIINKLDTEDLAVSANIAVFFTT